MESTLSTVPSSVFVWLFLEFILAIAIPVVLLIYWKKRTKCSFVPFLAGAVIFVVFALVLESIPKLLLLSGNNALSNYILSHAWAYTLTGCLLAGVFEEIGRYVAFRFFLKKHTEKECSIAYGIGHGGIEAILILCPAVLSYITIASMINNGTFEPMLASYSEAEAASLLASAQALTGLTWSGCLLGILERICAITLHVSLSVLVFRSVNEKDKQYFLPLAILLHGLFDVPAALGQFGVISIPVCEIIIALLALLIALYAYRSYKEIGNDSVAS